MFIRSMGLHAGKQKEEAEVGKARGCFVCVNMLAFASCARLPAASNQTHWNGCFEVKPSHYDRYIKEYLCLWQ